MCLNNTGKWLNLTGRDILFMRSARKGYGGPGSSTKESSVMAAICLKMQIWSLNYSFPFFLTQLSWWRLLHHVYLYAFCKLNIAFLDFCQYLAFFFSAAAKTEKVIFKRILLHDVWKSLLCLLTLRSKVKTDLIGLLCTYWVSSLVWQFYFSTMNYEC